MDAFLYLPRLLKPLLSSCGIVWLLLLLMGVYLIRVQQSKKIGVFCLSLALFMNLTGSGLLPIYLLGTLEKPYQNVRLEELPRCGVGIR